MSNDLQERFPNMRPINGGPAMFTLNGFGTSVYGARSHDAQTGTYVKTLCLTALFVPVFCLAAYRVASAGNGGWYFIGKEPLSWLAKGWNVLVLSSIAGVVAWIFAASYFNSDDYVDGKKLADAQQLVEEGDLPSAAILYQQVIDNRPKHRGEAMDQFADLLNNRLAAAPKEQAPPVLSIAVALRRKGRLRQSQEELLALGIDLAKQHAKDDPLAAMATFEAVESLGVEQPDVVAFRRELLEQVVKANPTNVPYVVSLCERLEAEGELDRCRELLTPIQEKLGETEGARILGQMLADEGKLDEAHALLVPYTTGRLDKLHEAEQEFSDAWERAYQLELDRLNRGDGPQAFYTRYDAASGEEAKGVIVDEHLMSAVKDDPGIAAAREEMRKQAEIVPTALDLGILLLQRAQLQPTAEARQKELEQAEQTFLAIRGVAGESDEYRMFLGQVYYWLGKIDEGQSLFDELLAANDRGFDHLLAVGSILREVGETAQARAVTEEAYNKANDPAEKHRAAHQRALMWQDLDDEVHWLRLSDLDNPHVKASLATTLGQQAQRAGKQAEAEAHFREAIAAHDEMPESASTLNNSAMTFLSLYRANGDQAALEESQRRLEKAVSLNPSDSILLYNAGTMLMQVGVAGVASEKLDPNALHGSASLSLLPFLYSNEAELNQVKQRLRDNEAMKKGIDYFNKLLVLSPKKADVYQMLDSIHSLQDDVEALEQLAEHLRAADPDISDTLQEHLSLYTGDADETLLKDGREAIALWRGAAAKLKGKDAMSYAVAQHRVIDQEIALARLGENVDPNAVVSGSEELLQATPCAATHRGLIQALLFRADLTLQANADYRTVYERTHKSMSAGRRIGLALAESEELRDVIADNADFQRAIKLIKEDGERLPQERSPWEWALLQAVDADAAKKVANRLAEDKAGQISRQILLQLTPADTNAVLNEYWAQLAAGNEAAAEDVMTRAQALGVPKLTGP